MEAKDIPKDCLKNMVLKATLETEIKKKRQHLKVVQSQIEAVKRSIESKYNNRKAMKKLLEIETEKSKILEPTLKALSASCEEKKFELMFLEEDLDSDSLKMKDEQLKYQEIVNNYKKIWETYQKEYEKLDKAIQRKEVKIKVEKKRIEVMMLEYKRDQLIKMLEQREAINDMRLKVLIKEMSQLVLDRWKQQNYQQELEVDIVNLSNQYEEINEQHKKIQQDIEEEAKAKALARQLMPAPRIDTSMLQLVYSATPRPTEKKVHRKQSITPDSLSLCSAIIGQLYNENEQAFGIKNNNEEEKEEEEEDIELLPPSSSCRCSQETDGDQVSQQSQHEHDVNILENECRQLSICEEFICEENNDKKDCSNNIEAEEIICEAVIEAPRLPVSKEAYLGPVAHSRKKLSDSIGSINEISEEPERKRSKLSDDSHVNLVTWSEDEKNKTQDPKNKILPTIRKIETINETIKIQTKPPMAEVPPTPNLYSNRHYASSCTSNEDRISMVGDGNYEIDTNWQNFSPPNRVNSDISFMSNASMVRNIMYDTPIMPTHSSDMMSKHPIIKESNPVPPTSQANDLASNFLSCFSSAKPSAQNFF